MSAAHADVLSRSGGPEPDGPQLIADRDGPIAEPAREDRFIGGLTEAIGGALGDHAVRGRGNKLGRIFTPVRIIIVLALLTLGAHYVQKYPCQDAAWSNWSQYKYFCYTDVVALYYAEGLDKGERPYYDHKVEYPVLTGALMGVIGLPVHNYAVAHPNSINEIIWFYNGTAIVLFGFALASVAVALALRRRRPWDAAMIAVAPAMIVTATVNWDLFAIGLTALFMFAWARKHPWLAGMLLGLAAAAKFYPLFLAGPLLILALRTGRWRHALATVGTAAVTWAAVNAPVYFGAYEGWHEFWRLSSERGIDWGTFWYIGTHFPVGVEKYGLEPFNKLGADIPLLNTVYQGLFALCCVGIGLLALFAKRKPRLAQLFFLVVAVFLLTSKVWSQQFGIWLIPLAVLARPRWSAFLAWQVAELLYFFAFYGELLTVSGKQIFQEWVFVLAATGRWVTVLILVVLVVRDILRPERDMVRRTYEDDPDGGVFDGAPDWVHLEKLKFWQRRERAADDVTALPALP